MARRVSICSACEIDWHEACVERLTRDQATTIDCGCYQLVDGPHALTRTRPSLTPTEDEEVPAPTKTPPTYYD